MEDGQYAAGAVHPPAVGNIPLGSCPSCPNNTPVSSLQMSGTHAWAIAVRCSECNRSWYICAICNRNNMLVRLSSDTARSKHHRSFHHISEGRTHVSSKKPRKSAEANEQFEELASSLDMEESGNTSSAIGDKELSPPNTSNVLLLSQRILETAKPPSISSGQLGNAHSINYFQGELSKKSLGAYELVSLSQFGVKSYSSSLSHKAVATQLLIMDFILALPRKRQIQFAEIMEAVTNPSPDEDAFSQMTPCSYPVSHATIRSLYTEGKYSISRNLPHPPISCLGDHSYMSVVHMTADFLAFCTELDTSWDKLDPVLHVSTLANSWQGQASFREAQRVNNFLPTLPVMVIRWSDDFEPNTQAKSNRSSVWCSSVSFCAPNKCNHNTYIMSLAHKDANHEEVEEAFNTELLDLSGGDVVMYHGGVGANVLVHVSLIVVLKDQPERRKGCHISLGNSLYTARWGYSLDLHQVRHLLPSCTHCCSQLLAIPTNEMNYCESCANWDYGSPLLHYTPPKHYPIEELPPDGMLQPKAITFEALTKDVAKAHDNYVSSMWTAKQLTSYLSVSGLNTEAIELILQSADDDHSWPTPASWSQTTDIQQLVDVIMHLLGLGVGKAINRDLIRTWLTKRKLLHSFLRSTAGTLASVQCLSLSWCKTMPAGKEGNLGGWVSENHFAWVRVSKWYYSCLDDLLEDIPYTPPDKPLVRWIGSELKAWLRARQVPFPSTLRVPELRLLVTQLMSAPGGPPAVVGPIGGPARNVQNVVICLVSMMAHLMGPMTVGPESPGVAETMIKLFLSSVHQLDSLCRDSTQQPIWVAKSNFVCLLNLPSAMKRFGPLRLLWEGGNIGEGILRDVKPLVNNLNGRWHAAAHTRYARDQSIEKVRQIHTSSTPTSSSSGEAMDVDLEDDISEYPTGLGEHGTFLLSSERYSNFRRYKSISEVAEGITASKPISAVVSNKGVICVVTSTNGLYRLLHGDLVTTVCGLAYFHYFLSQQEVCDVTLSDRTVQMYCLLLPLLGRQRERVGVAPVHLGDGNSAVNIYACITSNWMEQQADGLFDYPQKLRTWE